MGWPALLDTARLRLRPPSFVDAPAITEYASEPEVTRHVSWRRHRTAVEAYNFLSHAIQAIEEQRELHWAITRRATGILLGMIGLRLEGPRAELGYVLARPYWGQGVATEAAQAVVAWALGEAAIWRVWAVCHVDHPASARVLEKIGMGREGRLERWVIFPNLSDEPRDCWCYARVKR